MSNKIKKDFEFVIPVSKISGMQGRKSPALLGNITVLGFGYDLGIVPPNEARYSSILENVFYQDIDLLPLIQATESLQPFYNEIIAAAHSHVEKFLFKKDQSLILQLVENE